MKLLEERILRDGKVYPGEVLKVGGFLNHLIDDGLLEEIGKEIYAHFRDKNVNKLITIEASGIAIACYAARHFHAPVLFAKKSKTANISSDVSTVFVEKEYLRKGDRVLIIDDFLAHGEAMRGLIELVGQAGAELVGCAAAIEKGFQGGGDALRAKGIDLYSLAVIDSMNEGKIVFREQD